MRDYVRSDVRAEVETDAEASWIGVGAGVGDLGDTGRVGEAQGD